MRLIDADELIEDLHYDVELDDHALDSTDIAGLSRVMCQIERGCKQEMVDMLKQAPTIEQPQWIPCSERLPKVGEDVLFSVAGVYAAEGCLRADGNWAQFRWDGIQHKNMVDAWMPLPEPYEGQK